MFNPTSLLESIRTMNEAVSIERTAEKAIAQLTSYDSAPYTKIANDLTRLGELEKEVKELKETIKKEQKEKIVDLFTEAEDTLRTRVVETVSFILTLSKDPKETVTPKYKDILEKLSESFTPELLKQMTELQKTLVTVSQKPPNLKVVNKKAMNESKELISESVVKFTLEKIKFMASKLKEKISNWASSYDKKLAKLKEQL